MKPESAHKIRFVPTKGDEYDYHRFVEYFKICGIKVVPIIEYEVNLDFEDN